MSSPLAREMVMAEAMVSAEQAAIRSPNRLPVPTESQTMISMPRTITAMAAMRRGPRPLAEEEPGEKCGEHRVEGEDEDEIRRRGVVDGCDEEDRTDPVERGDDEALAAGNEFWREGVASRQTAQMTSAATKVTPAPQQQHGPWLAVGELEQRDVDGERKPAYAGDEQALGVIGVVGWHVALR